MVMTLPCCPDQLITGFPNYLAALSSCGSRNREGPPGRLMTWGWAWLISEEGRKCLLYAQDLVQEREDLASAPKGLRVYHLYFISSLLPTLHSILTWPCPGPGLPISLGPPQ